MKQKRTRKQSKPKTQGTDRKTKEQLTKQNRQTNKPTKQTNATKPSK